jgi:endonuclease-3
MKDKYGQTLNILKKHYQEIPLERFGKDLYKTTIATILSARTRDEVTYTVCKEKLFPKASNINELSKLSIKEIEENIYPVGFYKTKAKNLNKLATEVIEKYKGKLPESKEELIKLPGIGPKTANVIVNRVFDLPTIAVDTHVHKIANILKWVQTKTPQQTENELKKTLPKKYWSEVSNILVSTGRQFRSERKLIDFFKNNKIL